MSNDDAKIQKSTDLWTKHWRPGMAGWARSRIWAAQESAALYRVFPIGPVLQYWYLYCSTVPIAPPVLEYRYQRLALSTVILVFTRFLFLPERERGWRENTEKCVRQTNHLFVLNKGKLLSESGYKEPPWGTDAARARAARRSAQGTGGEEGETRAPRPPPLR
jgi:hypothetical protein